MTGAFLTALFSEVRAERKKCMDAEDGWMGPMANPMSPVPDMVDLWCPECGHRDATPCRMDGGALEWVWSRGERPAGRLSEAGSGSIAAQLVSISS